MLIVLVPVTSFYLSDAVLVSGQTSWYQVLVEGGNEVGIEIPFLKANGSL